ncbi:DUF397 domain-containing protein [Nocardia cyriacigeorgica]|uniref:DUF397 domain-containing protein n=1 Tax=Nocardia cyriacigeorgica TaxID=135487 RepID=UPI003EE0BE84
MAESVTNRVAGAWRKSTFSNPSGNCVEMAEATNNLVAVRNSREPDSGILFYTRPEMMPSSAARRPESSTIWLAER